MDLSSPGQLDPVQAIKSGEESMRVILDVLMIVLEDRSEIFMLRVMDRLDDEAIVS